MNRRSFLCGAAAFAVSPAFAAVPKSGEVDVLIVGAGAAGIAAARRIVAAGRRCAVIEAGRRVGGRCITESASFGVPFDRGAHWINRPHSNPIVKRAGSGFHVGKTSISERIRIDGRASREREREDFLVALEHSRRAIAEAASGKADIASRRVLPRDLGDWRSTIEFVLGPYGCSKDLAEASARDLAMADEREIDAVCREGYGALLTHAAAGLPVSVSTHARRIERGRDVVVETNQGTFTARAVIVTVSTNVLASGSISFMPALPRQMAEAANLLSLGSFDHIGLELAGNPLDLLTDDMVFEQAKGRETAALLANVSGTNLCLVSVGGGFGRELAARGERAMIDFAIEWLSRLYGANLKKSVKRRAATNWDKDPFVRGARSVAAPGGQPARRLLMEPVHERIWFAGEAVHETLYGTVLGAWESGDRAAASVLKQLSEPARRRNEVTRRGKSRSNERQHHEPRGARRSPAPRRPLGAPRRPFSESPFGFND